MTPRLLTEQHLEFLSLTGGCTGSSESTLVKMPHCWKSQVAAHMDLLNIKENEHLKQSCEQTTVHEENIKLFLG